MRILKTPYSNSSKSDTNSMLNPKRKLKIQKKIGGASVVVNRSDMKKFERSPCRRMSVIDE